MHRHTNSFKHIYTAKYLSYCTRSSSKYKQFATPSSTLKPLHNRRLQTHRKLTYNTNPKLTNAHVKPYCIHKPLFLNQHAQLNIKEFARCPDVKITNLQLQHTKTNVKLTQIHVKPRCTHKPMFVNTYTQPKNEAFSRYPVTECIKRQCKPHSLYPLKETFAQNPDAKHPTFP